MGSPSRENNRSRSPTKGRKDKRKKSKQKRYSSDYSESRSRSSGSSPSCDKRESRNKQYEKDRRSSNYSNDRYPSQRSSGGGGSQSNNYPNQFPSQGPGPNENYRLGTQNDFQGSTSQRNFQQGLLGKYPGSGPKGSFESSGPRNNFQGLSVGAPGSFHGPNPQGSYQKPNFQDTGANNFQGQFPQGNFHRPQDSFQGGIGQQCNFQGQAPIANFQGSGTQGNFQGQSPQGIFHGIRPQGNFYGQGPQGNVQGQGQQGNFHGQGPQGSFQGQIPQGNFLGQGPIGSLQGNFQVQGPQGNFQGQGPQGNFQVQGPQGNFQGQGPQGNFQRQNSQGNYQAPCQQNNYPIVSSQPGNIQQQNNYTNYQGAQSGYQNYQGNYQNYQTDVISSMQSEYNIQAGNSANETPIMYQANNQANSYFTSYNTNMGDSSTSQAIPADPSFSHVSSSDATSTSNVVDIPEPVLPPLPKYLPSSKEKPISFVVPTIDIALPPLPPGPLLTNEKKENEAKQKLKTLPASSEMDCGSGIEVTKDKIKDKTIMEPTNQEIAIIADEKSAHSNIKEILNSNVDDIKVIEKSNVDEIKEADKHKVEEIKLIKKGESDEAKENEDKTCASKDVDGKSIQFDSKDNSDVKVFTDVKTKSGWIPTLDLLSLAIQPKQIDNSTVSCNTDASIAKKTKQIDNATFTCSTNTSVADKTKQIDNTTLSCSNTSANNKTKQVENTTVSNTDVLDANKTKLPPASAMHDKKALATSTTLPVTKKLNLPCLGKEAAKKRLRSFSSSNFKKEIKSPKIAFLQPQQQQDEFADDKDMKSSPMQKEMLEEERKEKKRKDKRKEKVSVIEQIKEEETRIKEVLSIASPNNPFNIGLRMAEISNLFDNPEALRKFEARGKDFKEKLEKGQLSSPNKSSSKKRRDRSGTPSKRESSRQSIFSSKRAEEDEQRRESRLSLKKSAEEETKVSPNKAIEEKKSELKSSSKKTNEDENKKKLRLKDCGNVSKSFQKCKKLKRWQDLTDLNMTLEEYKTASKSKHTHSRSYSRSHSRSPNRSRRDSGSRGSRRSRSHSRDRSSQRSRENISPFPEFPKQFETFKISNAMNYGTKEVKGSFVQYTLADPSIPYSVAPGKLQDHYWNRRELKIKNTFHPDIIDIVEEFWDIKLNSGVAFKERPKMKHPWFIDDFISCDNLPDEEEKGKSIKKGTALDYLSSSYKADTALQMFEKEMEAADTLIEKLKSRENKESSVKTTSADDTKLYSPTTCEKKKKKHKTDSKAAPKVDLELKKTSSNDHEDCGNLRSQELNEEYEAFINTLEIKPEEVYSLSDDTFELNASLMSFDDSQESVKEPSDIKPPSDVPKKKQKKEEEPMSRKEIKKLLMNSTLSKKRRKKLKRLKKNLKKEKRDKKKKKKELKRQRKAEKKLKKKQEKLLAQKEIDLNDEELALLEQVEPTLPQEETGSSVKNITEEIEDYEVVEWEEYDDEGTVRELRTEVSGEAHKTIPNDNLYRDYQASENEEAYDPSSMSYSDMSSGFYDMSHSSHSVSSISSLGKPDETDSYSDTANQSCEVAERYSPSNMSVCSVDSVDNSQEYSPSQVKISSPYSPPSPEQEVGNSRNSVRSPSPYSPSSPQSSSNSDTPGDNDVKESRPSQLDTIPMPPSETDLHPSVTHKLEETHGTQQTMESPSAPGAGIISQSEDNLVPLQKASQPVTFRLGSIKQSPAFRLLQKAPLPGFSEEGEEEDGRSLTSILGKKAQKMSVVLTEKTKTIEKPEEACNLSSKANEQSQSKTDEKREEEEGKQSTFRSRNESTPSKKDKKRDKRDKSLQKEGSQSPVSKWKRIKSPPPKRYRDKSPDWERHQRERHRERKHSRTRSKSSGEKEHNWEHEAKKSPDHMKFVATDSSQPLSDSSPRPIDSISNLFNQGSNQPESWDWAGPGNEAPMEDHKEFYHGSCEEPQPCLSSETQRTKSISPDDSPKRLSLDERLKQEHGVEIEEEPVPPQVMYPPTQGGYYWEYNPPPTHPSLQVSAPQTGSGKPQVIRVGNVLQVLPQENPEKPVQEPSYEQGKEQAPKMVQAGNVIQVVPTNFQDASSDKIVSGANDTPVDVAPVPPPTQNPLALISSLLASSISQPISASEGAASSAMELASGNEVPQPSLGTGGEEKTAPASLDSQQQQAILSAVAAAAASGVTASNLPIAHLISVLQQQNLLTQPASTAAGSEQAPESSLPGISQSQGTKGIPPQFDLEAFKQQRRERKERKRKEREQRRKARRQKALIKKLELEANMQPVLNEALDEEDTVYKEAISEVPELGSPVPDYEVYNEEEFGDEGEEEEKKLPFVPLPDPPEKGILIEPSNSYKILRNKDHKSVSFADGVMPGYGTSPSGGEEIHSPPPPSAKTEKKEKKQKVRKKKKIKVRIIKQYLFGENRMDSPPPPPESPPTPGVLKLYPGCTYYTCTAPGTFVIYTQQASETDGRTTDLQLAAGSTVTIPPGMLIHSSALSKSFVPGSTGDRLDTSIPPSMPNTYPGYAISTYYIDSAPTEVATGIGGSHLLQSPLA